MFHNAYNPYGFNPNAYAQTTQNRLNQLEMQNNMQNYPANIPNPQPIQQMNNSVGFLKGRAVTSIDEAKASMIDLDGSLYIFTDIANKRIYTKQINNNGVAELKIYELSENEMPAPQMIPLNNEMEELKTRIAFLEQQMHNFKSNEKEVIISEHESNKSNKKYFK